MGLLICAKRTWAEWTQCHRNSFLSHPSSTQSLPYLHGSTRLIGWTNPLDAVIKFNFDGSLSPADAAAGYVLQNSQGQLLQAIMFEAPILVSEATALRHGIKAAKDAGVKYIHIEGDNQMVIQAVKGGIHTP